MRINVPADQEPMIFIWTSIASPVLRQAIGALTQAMAVNDSTVTEKEREAMRYYLAFREDCNACKSSRFGLIRPDWAGRGMTEEWYDAIPNYETSSVLTDRERLVIEFTSRLFDDHRDLEQDDDLWSRMQSQFDELEIQDLVVISSFVVGMNRIRETLLGPTPACAIERTPAESAAS